MSLLLLLLEYSMKEFVPFCCQLKIQTCKLFRSCVSSYNYSLSLSLSLNLSHTLYLYLSVSLTFHFPIQSKLLFSPKKKPHKYFHLQNSAYLFDCHLILAHQKLFFLFVCYYPSEESKHRNN